MAHGTITAKPNIASLTRDGVRFTDGSEVRADIVVYCTGYKVTFPFFDEGFISAPDNDLPLFRRMFHPDIPNVFFIGLLQPLGAVMPIAERQSSGSATTSRAATRCPRRPTCAPTSSASGARCSSATSPPSATRCRSTSTTTSWHWPRSARRARSVPARTASGCPCRPRGRPGRGVSGAALAGRRERTKAANRAAILSAGREVFAEIGFGAASVRHIVRRTDLAAGTFYNYFPDKEAVFRDLVGEVAEEARRRVRAARRPPARRASSSRTPTAPTSASSSRTPAAPPSSRATWARSVRCSRSPRGRSGSASWPRTCAPRSTAARCRRSTSTTARGRWSRSGSSSASGSWSATRPTSTAPRASPPSSSWAGSCA